MRTYLRWQDVNPTELRGHAAVVIDVLRWSTVVVTALTNGAEWVDAVATPDDARSHAATLGRAGIVLGGERGNVALPGFDAGNSPLEYTADRVQGLGVVTTTTNGTQGLLAAREADAVIVGAFVNLPAVLRALEGERLAGRPVALIACGQEGEQALEDVACAGAIATMTDRRPARAGAFAPARQASIKTTPVSFRAIGIIRRPRRDNFSPPTRNVDCRRAT